MTRKIRDGWVFQFLATTKVNGKTQIRSSLQISGYTTDDTEDEQAVCSLENNVITISNTKRMENIQLSVNSIRAFGDNQPGVYVKNIYYDKNRIGYISSVELVAAPAADAGFYKIKQVSSGSDSGNYQNELKTGKMINVPNKGSIYQIDPSNGLTLPSGTYKLKISFIDTAI